MQLQDSAHCHNDLLKMTKKSLTHLKFWQHRVAKSFLKLHSNLNAPAITDFSTILSNYENFNFNYH